MATHAANDDTSDTAPAGIPSPAPPDVPKPINPEPTQPPGDPEKGGVPMPPPGKSDHPGA